MSEQSKEQEALLQRGEPEWPTNCRYCGTELESAVVDVVPNSDSKHLQTDSPATVVAQDSCPNPDCPSHDSDLAEAVGAGRQPVAIATRPSVGQDAMRQTGGVSGLSRGIRAIDRDSANLLPRSATKRSSTTRSSSWRAGYSRTGHRQVHLLEGEPTRGWIDPCAEPLRASASLAPLSPQVGQLRPSLDVLLLGGVCVQ